METITKEFEVYSFDELDERTQEKILNKFCDINVDYDWFEYAYEGFNEQLKELGLKCNGYHEEATPINLGIQDMDLFISKLDIKVKPSIVEIADLYITYKGYRNMKPLVESYSHYKGRHKRIDKAVYELVDKANDKVQDMLSEFTSQLQKEYEYLTSSEAIKETIEANEYKFLEDGSIFY